MLPRKHRLTKKTDFKNVLEKGRFIKGKFLSIVTSENKNGISQIGIIVSNKVSKKATERNRLKRLIRQTARQHLSDLVEGRCVVFLVGRRAAGAKHEEIARETQTLLGKSGTLRGFSMKK